MQRWFVAAALAAGMVAFGGPSWADGTTMVSGEVVDREPGVPVAILVRGADGQRRDLLLPANGKFVLTGLRNQKYTFQAERPQNSGAMQVALGLPVTLYIYEGARYNITFPYPRHGRLAAPHAVDGQAADVNVVR